VLSAEDRVNKLEIRGNWKQLSGHAKQTWEKLTDDDLNRIDGRRLALIGSIQRHYGTDLAVAEDEVDAWLDSMERRAAGR
jgi:uncharacterized protein YjbJ (UPF0337 family)